MFASTGPHYCECQANIRNQKGRVIGRPLELSEDNYSGCGVDIANCPVCGKGYCVSYKVDKIEREPAWDVKLEHGNGDWEL